MDNYSWEVALARALEHCDRSTRKWYVRGWWSEQSGKWLYDAYSYPVLFAWKRRALESRARTATGR